MMSKMWMTGCYISLALTPIVSYWHIRWGALAALVAIAMAHISGIKRAEEINYDTQQALFILLEQMTSLHHKMDATDVKPDVAKVAVLAQSRRRRR